jgi:hypothetical protein
VTSAAEVVVPCILNLLNMCLDNLLNLGAPKEGFPAISCCDYFELSEIIKDYSG